ncbi:MAG: DNA polymerase IV, partial [Gemmatimonadota bacterium]|nr:DNA polymerase IV [Gemmatimonadota bacterium]
MPERTPATDESSRILLADADAFYVAVARLEDPDGAGKEPLLIVGGSKQRGVVTSASYEARAFGVRSAMPTSQALRLCPKAVLVPVSRKACAERSRAIQSVLNRFTPVVEPASIDEFYLDMSGTEKLYREPLAQTARTIRDTVYAETEMYVSIGGGTSKVVAKIAAKEAKPRREVRDPGVYIVQPGEEIEFMSKLQLADIPLVGPKFQESLARYGLRTVQDTLKHEESTLCDWFGKRTGRWLYRRIRGLDESRVHGRQPAKSLSHEETFAEDICTTEDLERELVKMAVRVAADLRKQSYRARTFSVKLKDSNFRVSQASHTLSEPVSADRPIVETARMLFRRLRKKDTSPIRLMGVGASQLTGADQLRQMALFDDSGAVETDADRK